MRRRSRKFSLELDQKWGADQRNMVYHSSFRLSSKMSIEIPLLTSHIMSMILRSWLFATEGEILDPDSIITLPRERGLPVFPDFGRSRNDLFLRAVQRSRHKWVIIVDPENKPQVVLDADILGRLLRGMVVRKR